MRVTLQEGNEKRKSFPSLLIVHEVGKVNERCPSFALLPQNSITSLYNIQNSDASENSLKLPEMRFHIYLMGIGSLYFTILPLYLALLERHTKETPVHFRRFSNFHDTCRLKRNSSRSSMLLVHPNNEFKKHAKSRVWFPRRSIKPTFDS